MLNRRTNIYICDERGEKYQNILNVKTFKQTENEFFIISKYKSIFLFIDCDVKIDGVVKGMKLIHYLSFFIASSKLFLT